MTAQRVKSANERPIDDAYMEAERSEGEVLRDEIEEEAEEAQGVSFIPKALYFKGIVINLLSH